MQIPHGRVLHLDRTECVHDQSLLHNAGALCEDCIFAVSSEVLSKVDDQRCRDHQLGRLVNLQYSGDVLNVGRGERPMHFNSLLSHYSLDGPLRDHLFYLGILGTFSVVHVLLQSDRVHHQKVGQSLFGASFCTIFSHSDQQCPEDRNKELDKRYQGHDHRQCVPCSVLDDEQSMLPSYKCTSSPEHAQRRLVQSRSNDPV